MRNDRTRITRRCGATAFSVAMVMVAPTVGYTQAHLATLMNLFPWLKLCAFLLSLRRRVGMYGGHRLRAERWQPGDLGRGRDLENHLRVLSGQDRG